MGYIRLVRSGSIHANYSASLYLPKFDENLQFVNKAKEDSLQDVTINAAENFEINIKNLEKSFSDSTDYFKVNSNMFQINNITYIFNLSIKVLIVFLYYKRL